MSRKSLLAFCWDAKRVAWHLHTEIRDAVGGGFGDLRRKLVSGAGGERLSVSLTKLVHRIVFATSF
uniref:Uncharacterized protein n=1 Tax=OCS116 cluster bacterium TaxID=2030921 RepID=A0A2A4Z9U5_9PROT